MHSIGLYKETDMKLGVLTVLFHEQLLDSAGSESAFKPHVRKEV